MISSPFQIKSDRLEGALQNYLPPTGSQEFYFGSSGFLIEPFAELAESQLGYSVDPDGENLVTGKEGDWQATWVVIGQDMNLGDPYFVDFAQEKLPVYTAMHGSGSWEAEIVSETLDGFIKSLNNLQNLSGQKEMLINPTADTKSDPSELVELRDSLIHLCGPESSMFWETFINIHLEWIVDSEHIDE